MDITYNNSIKPTRVSDLIKAQIVSSLIQLQSY